MDDARPFSSYIERGTARAGPGCTYWWILACLSDVHPG